MRLVLSALLTNRRADPFLPSFFLFLSMSSVDDLVGTNGKKKRGTGPAGKMRQLFEAASRLPRSQQQKITAVLEAFTADNRGA